MGGALIHLTKRLRIGQEYVLTLGTGSASVTLKAAVIRESLAGFEKNEKGESVPKYEVGLKFENVLTGEGAQLIDFIQNSGIVTAMVGLLQAPAGTRLYARMEQEGRLCSESSGDNVDGTTNIIPAMRLETLKEGYRRILDHIYSPAPYTCRSWSTPRPCRTVCADSMVASMG